MSKKKIAAITVSAIALGFSAQADTGQNTASTTIQLRAFVPVLCNVNLSQSVGTADNDGIVDMGVAREFCNAPRGYRVLIRHAENLEGAALISDGLRIPLSPGGETVLTDSQHPDLRAVSLAIDLGQTPDRFRSIGMRIEAKG